MIKLVNIHKIFDNGETGFLALKDINLDFKEDHFVCILGKSGSGKTTLLNIIGGLDKASTGHMVIEEALTTKFTERQWDYFRNYKIGFIFQNYSLIEHLNVLDNVMIASKMQGASPKEAKEKALKLLDQVNILEQAYKLPKQLSGGQRQRVSIARALINDPEVILADEPTGSLDKKTSHDVLELIKKISQDKLVIMVTHNKRIASEYADRIIELKDGEVISDSKPYDNEKVRIRKNDNNKTKFRLRDKIAHAFKNIRTKKIRSFLTAFGLSIGITGYILINGISHGVKTNFDKQLSAYDNTPDLIFHLNNPSEDFNVDDKINLLLEDDRIQDVRYNKNIYLRPVKLNNVDLINHHDSEPIYYPFSDRENDFQRYFGRLYEDGQWPIGDDEIVISKNFASSLYDYTSTKTLWEKLKGSQLELVTEYYYDPFIIYDFKGLPEGHATYTYIDQQTVPEGYDAETYGSFESQIATQLDLFNRVLLAPFDMNQIIILKDYTPYLKYYSPEVKSTKTFTVVGLNDAVNVDFSLVNKDTYLEFKSSQFNWEVSDSYQFDIFVKESADDDFFEIKRDYRDQFFIEERAKMPGLDIPVMDMLIGIVEFIIGLIMFVAVITSGIMLLMVLLISVIERSREIGILRALGATRSDIMSIFTVESGVIGFLAGIIGVILAYGFSFVGDKIIYHYFKDEIMEAFNNANINFIMIKPQSVIIGIVACIFLAMVFGIIPAISASKKTPINALKRIK